MGHLGGLCSSLLASGTSGRHPQNVKRDILRKLAARNPESQVPCQNKQPLLHFKHVSDHVSSQINYAELLRCLFIMFLFLCMNWVQMETTPSNKGLLHHSETTNLISTSFPWFKKKHNMTLCIQGYV